MLFGSLGFIVIVVKSNTPSKPLLGLSRAEVQNSSLNSKDIPCAHFGPHAAVIPPLIPIIFDSETAKS